MMTRLLVGSLAVVLATAGTVPTGTELHARLLTKVSSDQPSGQAVEAVLTTPVMNGASIILPSGLKLTGTTTDTHAAQAAQGQTAETPAQLRLVFDRISDTAGHGQAIGCRLTEVENARESVDESGLILGIKASQTMEARINQGIGKLGARNQGLATLLGGLTSAVVKPVDASVTFAPGVDFTVRLTQPLVWNEPIPTGNQPLGFDQPVRLQALVDSEPMRTVAQNPPSPSDLINMMFIGTREELTKAFEQAGWSTAAQLSGDSKLETARAIIEDRGYSQAPVSILMLDGQPPDLTFQKQNDTFAKRHHIRIWKRPGSFDGKPIWLAAATHDIKIDFSPESKTFTHGIDSNIDAERGRVVNDLVFTGNVHRIALVRRAHIPANPTNATGDKLQTDGTMAVLAF